MRYDLTRVGQGFKLPAVTALQVWEARHVPRNTCSHRRGVLHRVVLRDAGRCLCHSKGGTVNGRALHVTNHAVEQARLRFRLDLADEAVAHLIAYEVRDGFLHGRTLNHKPKTFRLYGQRGHQLGPGERFVYDGSESRGFIVKREPDEDVVVTALCRAWTEHRGRYG